MMWRAIFNVKASGNRIKYVPSMTRTSGKLALDARGRLVGWQGGVRLFHYGIGFNEAWEEKSGWRNAVAGVDTAATSAQKHQQRSDDAAAQGFPI